MSSTFVRFLIFGVALLVTCVAAKTPLRRCGPNEQVGRCGRDCEEKCYNTDWSKCASTSCVGSACQCKPGFRRNEDNDLCVLPDQCPKPTKPPNPCGPNEQLGNCGRLCEEKCDNTDLSECAATSCAGSACQCKPGFRRNKSTDLCVSADQCPKPKCKKNEILAACGKTCEATCEHPFTPLICRLIKCSTQGCRCDLSKGYVFDKEANECVRNQDNKRCAAKLKCPRHSKPKLCGGVCEPTCSNPEQIFCKLDPTNCVINCECSKNYVKNELTGQCVKRKHCPHGPNASSSDSSGSSHSSDSSSDSNDSDE